VSHQRLTKAGSVFSVLHGGSSEAEEIDDLGRLLDKESAFEHRRRKNNWNRNAEEI